MGTINYGTSKYISLGYDLSDNNYYCRMIDFYDSDEDREELECDVNCLYEIINDKIKELDLECFKITCEYGYYEGLYLDIDLDYCYFDNYQEKQAAQKEITTIKHFLLDTIEYGHIVKCENGWCTTYCTYEETKAAIKEAIKEMRNDVKNTLTAKNYNRYWYMV